MYIDGLLHKHSTATSVTNAACPIELSINAGWNPRVSTLRSFTSSPLSYHKDLWHVLVKSLDLTHVSIPMRPYATWTWFWSPQWHLLLDCIILLLLASSIYSSFYARICHMTGLVYHNQSIWTWSRRGFSKSVSFIPVYQVKVQPPVGFCTELVGPTRAAKRIEPLPTVDTSVVQLLQWVSRRSLRLLFTVLVIISYARLRYVRPLAAQSKFVVPPLLRDVSREVFTWAARATWLPWIQLQ